MQYSQEHLKTMVYAEFGGQTECIMGNWKIENWENLVVVVVLVSESKALYHFAVETSGGKRDRSAVFSG